MNMKISDVLKYADKNDLHLEVATEDDYDELPEDHKCNKHKERAEDPLTEEYFVYDNNNKLIGYIGLERVNYHTGEIWGDIIDKEYAKSLTQISKKMVEMWKKEYGRLQSFVSERDESALKFNKLLGLEKEAKLKNLEPNKNYILMNWLEDNNGND